jgi:hypothetical protein
MTMTTDFFDMSAAPMRVGEMRLKVRDLDTISLRDPWGIAITLKSQEN